MDVPMRKASSRVFQNWAENNAYKDNFRLQRRRFHKADPAG